MFMKRLLPLIFILALGACNSEKHSNLPDSLQLLVDNRNKVDSAKTLLDESTTLTAKGIRGTMKRSEVNAKLKPVMEKYFAIFKRLAPEDTIQVNKYRSKKINELIDLQITYGGR